MNILKKYRADHGMTRAELAQRLKCSTAMVGHIENGIRNITPRKAKEWSPILGIPKEKLCDVFADA